MSRHLVKIAFSAAIALGGFFGISAACGISPQAGRQYDFADNNCNVPPAIQTVKRVLATGDHFQMFMKEWDSNIRYMAVPNNKQRWQFDADFTGLVSNLWFNQNRKSSSKLGASLQGLLPDMWSKYKDETEPFENRTKFAYLYFLTFATAEALKNTSDSTLTTEVTTPATTWGAHANQVPGLTFIQSYTTINGMEYGLWHSDIFYLFSKGDSTDVNVSRRAKSLDDLINYIEYQNRIVMRAPNGRYYAIRKFGDTYQVNRDNGTILPQLFPSYEAAKQMLETCAVNGYVAPQYRGMCGFGSYGKR